MSVFYWIALLVLLTVLTGKNADIITSEDGTSKWVYHEKSKQVFSIGNSIPDALFGYSIAYQEVNHSLIVGSPNESKIGKVYTCAIEDTSKKCDALISPALDHPHNLWLGANVNAGKSFLMACAPRTIKNNKGLTYVYGSCFFQNDWSQNNLMAMTTIQPDDEVRKRYHNAAYGVNVNVSQEKYSDTFGWSSYVTNKAKIFVGGPAMSVGRTEVYFDVTQAPHLIIVNNQKLGAKRVNFNFGYSITGGYFVCSGDDDEQIIAISSPYGTIGYGRVYLFKYSESESEYVPTDVFIEDKQVGSLFGAAVCGFSRGDNGLSALLVGAPAYSSSSSKSYDIGAVYVYNFTNKECDDEYEDDTVDVTRTILGHSSGGYFGAAIVSIGDFDGDSIDEVAIGAPYEQNGRGAVYIYSGKLLLTPENPAVEQGKKLYLQRILPQDGPNQYFGWALTAPSDFDSNGCRELAIGAPGGNYVTLLRCMASVRVSFKVVFPDLKDQEKTLSERDAFYSFEPCLIMTYPDKPNHDTLETEIAFEVKIIHQDVKILGADSNGVQVFNIALANTQTLICKTVRLKLPKDADYDEDIQFNITAKLKQNQNPLQSTSFNPRLVLLNGTTSLSQNYTMRSLPGSNIFLEMHLSDRLKDGYIIGSTVNETLTFLMHNNASTAHGACVIAQFGGVRISRLPPHICSYNADVLQCTKDTLKKSESWIVTVVLDTKQMTSAIDILKIDAKVKTRGCSKSTGKNLTTTIELISDNNINVTGYATEIKVTREELQTAWGKSFEHIYTIINSGVTTWTNLWCEISLPPGILKSAVYIVHDDSTSKSCVVNDTNHNATCKIEEAKQKSQVQIRVQMDIGPDDPIAAQILKGSTTTVDTKITLALKKGDIKEKRLSNKIIITEAPRAPLWIFIVAGLVGLLIIIIICWALHECGFLRRDKKNKLEELKENVKRQSMRRSAMLRQSTMEALKNQQDQSDQQKLVELSEENSGSTDELRYQDPARGAFEAELAKALSKNNKHTRVDAQHLN